MNSFNDKCPRCQSKEYISVDWQKEYLSIYAWCCKDCGQPRIYTGYGDDSPAPDYVDYRVPGGQKILD